MSFDERVDDVQSRMSERIACPERGQVGAAKHHPRACPHGFSSQARRTRTPLWRELEVGLQTVFRSPTLSQARLRAALR